MNDAQRLAMQIWLGAGMNVGTRGLLPTGWLAPLTRSIRGEFFKAAVQGMDRHLAVIISKLGTAT